MKAMAKKSLTPKILFYQMCLKFTITLTTLFKILIITLPSCVTFSNTLAFTSTYLLTRHCYYWCCFWCRMKWNIFLHLKYIQIHTQKLNQKNSVSQTYKKSPTQLFVDLTVKDAQFQTEHSVLLFQPNSTEHLKR